MTTDTSIPKILWKTHTAGRTGTLTIQKSECEKKLYFDQGELVYAESNLLHETLGKYLIAEGKLTSEQEQTAMIRAMESQKSLGQVLLDMKLFDSSTLSQYIRENLKSKMMSLFAWDAVTAEFKEGREFLESQVPFQFDLKRLILDGVLNHPGEDLMSQAFYKNEKKLKLHIADKNELKKTAWSVNEVAILKQCQKPILFKDLVDKVKLPLEDVAKNIWGFLTIDYVREVSLHEELSLDELVGMTLIQSLKPAAPPVPVQSVDPETLKIANEVAANHLQLMNLNHFELLGLPETATYVQIRDQFIEYAKKFNPGRFQSPEMRNFLPQAEEVFLRGVKAFAILSEFDLKTKYLDKLKSDRQDAQVSKKKPGETFKIQTQLLDADSQYQKGLGFLKSKNFAKAFEYFSYAFDIDSSKADYIAHLAWAKFNMGPERNAREAKDMLEKIMKAKKDQPWVEYYYGRILADTGQPKEGLTYLKRAAVLDPKNVEFLREIKRVETLK